MKIMKFSAPWCGPCRQLAKNLEPFKHNGIVIEEVDIDEQPELASKYNVMSIPTLILEENDKEVHRTCGMMSEDKISSLFKQYGISF